MRCPFEWRSFRRWMALAVASAALAGCGPLSQPLPVPLDAAMQSSLDGAWESLLSPVDRASAEELLDVIVSCSAYQLGVDRFDFRSEKKLSKDDASRVVMESHFDRDRPDGDRFTVTIIDRAGAIVRREEYTRTDLDLLRAPGPSDQEKWAARQARIAELFPLGPPLGSDAPMK